jgi:hypothetical protein
MQMSLPEFGRTVLDDMLKRHPMKISSKLRMAVALFGLQNKSLAHCAVAVSSVDEAILLCHVIGDRTQWILN